MGFEMGQNKPVPASAGHIDTDVADDEDFCRRMRILVSFANRRAMFFAAAVRRMRQGQGVANA